MEKDPRHLVCLLMQFKTIFTFYNKTIRSITLFYIAVCDGISKHALVKDSYDLIVMF